MSFIVLLFIKIEDQAISISQLQLKSLENMKIFRNSEKIRPTVIPANPHCKTQPLRFFCQPILPLLYETNPVILYLKTDRVADPSASLTPAHSLVGFTAFGRDRKLLRRKQLFGFGGMISEGVWHTRECGKGRDAEKEEVREVLHFLGKVSVHWKKK